MGINCVPITGVAGGANAITVKQQANVPLIFAGLFGTKTATITATASAAMAGAAPRPLNVAIVLDTTASMSTTDGGTNCTGSRLSCALGGVQTLLSQLSPCLTSLSSCGAATNGAVANPVDQVSLFVFPAVTTASAAVDYCAGGKGVSLTTVPYQTPVPAADTYQVVHPVTGGGFVSDYRTSDTASTLNSASDIVKAVSLSSSGTPSCMQNPGGQSTYYAGVIYAAQAALVAAQSANPGSSNVLIILSDGAANAAASKMAGTFSKTSGAYQSSVQECQQAVTAAQSATLAGTTVFAIGYGSTTDATQCSTDTTSGLSPCTTMQKMASSSSTFYTDYTSSAGGGCTAGAQNTANLDQIFKSIGSTLTLPRLIPNNTT